MLKALLLLLKAVLVYGIIGLVVGIVAALFGVGGGILMVPVGITYLHLTPQRAVGTSLAAIVLISFASAWKHYTLDNVDLKLACFMAIGAVVGGVFIGAPWADRMPGEVLKRAFGYFCMCIGVYYTGLPAALWHRLHSQ